MRLVYADRLTENGDPRGELISVQCALEGPASSKKAIREYKKREKAHTEQWLGELAPVLVKKGLAFAEDFSTPAR